MGLDSTLRPQSHVRYQSENSFDSYTSYLKPCTYRMMWARAWVVLWPWVYRNGWGVCVTAS